MSSAAVSTDLVLPARSRQLKSDEWQNWLALYKVGDFVKTDPIQFPHRWANASDWRTVELVAFLSAMLSYGNRKAIFTKLEDLMGRLELDPLGRVCEASPQETARLTKGLYYRFFRDTDFADILNCLGHTYRECGSLKAVWQRHYQLAHGDVRQSISGFRKEFFQPVEAKRELTYGCRFFLADPMVGGVAKRFNMFLRWMVRKDQIDLGLWADVMEPSCLKMPIDTHVARTAQYFKVSKRLTNDWKQVEVITSYFKRLSPEDPVQYDFALFGLGLALKNLK